MIDGIIIDPATAKLIIVDGARTVATTGGTLICVLQTEHVFSSVAAVFPDPPKSSAYDWTWSVQDNPFETGQYGRGESCATFIVATPQEYSAKSVLMDAPAGADFFVGSIQLSRTTAPLSTWMGRTLDVLPAEARRIPFVGGLSLLMEAEIGFARALHVYLDDEPASTTYRKLVLEVEQSVGPPVGGYTTVFGDGSSGPPFGGEGGGIVNGANTTTGPTNGIPVFVRQVKSYGYTDSTSSAIPTTYKWSGGNPCARDDTTQYLSQYTVDIRGRFGRRS
jgi:hypothetical protein